MSTFNALSDTYATRRNIPFPDTSTATRIKSSQLFLLKTCLTGEATGGTLSGTRSSNSLWAHVASSDGATYSTSTDLWGTTFDASKFLWNNVQWPSFNDPQSWIVLENAALGYQICLSCSWEPGGNAGVTYAPITTPFSGFAANARPNSAAKFNLQEFEYGYGSTTFTTDLTATAPYVAHFVTNATDGQYWFLCNRPGTGIFYHMHGLQKTVAADPSDTKNLFAVGSGINIGRGAGKFDYFVRGQASISGKNVAGTSYTAYTDIGMGPATVFGFGANGSPYSGNYGLDNTTAKYNAFPVGVMAFNPVAWRGTFPDLYQIGTAPIAAGIPTAGPSQERIVVGDVVIPFVGGSPNI